MTTSSVIHNVSNLSNVGYTPMQVKQAYNLRGSGDGSGITVSVLDFMGNPYVKHNLDIFSSEFNLPKATLNEFGTVKDNRFNFGAYIEPSVDTQWVHAISPGATINLIRAESYSVEGAVSAIRTALEIGTDIMLMTFQAEFQESYLQYNEDFYGNCVFIASAGDYGAQVNFPACLPSCISVGGTSLSIGARGERLSDETVWNGTGGGICTYFDIPDYQRRMEGINKITNGKRGVPDVSFLGDPQTGVSVYHSSIADGFGWYRSGGTSVSASIVAGIIANALSTAAGDIQLSNVINELYELAGGTQYTNARNKFYDIIQGENGRYYARRGYDLCTGLGSLINL